MNFVKFEKIKRYFKVSNFIIDMNKKIHNIIY